MRNRTSLLWRGPDPRILLVVAVAVGLWMPLSAVDWFWGHEKASYIYRTVEWATEMRRGLLYPRWSPDLYGGYGSPLFMFYAPVPYGSAGVLTALFLDPATALKVVALAMSVISGLGMYALVFGETRQRDAALLGALAYLATPYRIADLFVRGDIGEFSVLALLPIAVALYRAIAFEARPRRARWLAAGAAVSHALVIMTHPILGFWSTVMLGLIVVATATGLVCRGMWRRALFSMGALACAPGLAAVYVLPAMVYRSAAHTDIMATGWSNPQHQWILWENLFTKDVPFYSPNFFRVGSLIVVALVAVLVGLALNLRKGRRAVGWMALSLALVALTLPQGSWFWMPGLIPTAQFVQFPWRMLGPAILTASVALGIGFAAASERWGTQLRNGIAIAAGAAMLFGWAWPFVTLIPMNTQGVPNTSDALRQGVYAAMDEDGYLPRTAPSAPTSPRHELVLSTEGASAADVISDGSRHELTVRAEHGGAIALLALHAFPGWTVETVSGPGRVTMDFDARGLLRLHLPAAGSYRLRVWYASPPAERAGLLVSTSSALLLVLLLAYGPLLSWWRSRSRLPAHVGTVEIAA
jgi:hypothetical protein